jgi:hypothetical protein
MSTPESPPVRLLDQVRSALRLGHYSVKTEEAYVGWIRRFILFHGKRHASEMGEREVTAFLSHQAATAGVSASKQNQALAALLFLYRHVLGHELADLSPVVHARMLQSLPVVLTRRRSRLSGRSLGLHGSGIARSRQIFRARTSLISVWRGTDDVRLVAGFRKTEWRPPSRSSWQP